MSRFNDQIFSSWKFSKNETFLNFPNWIFSLFILNWERERVCVLCPKTLFQLHEFSKLNFFFKASLNLHNFAYVRWIKYFKCRVANLQRLALEIRSEILVDTSIDYLVPNIYNLNVLTFKKAYFIWKSVATM